MTRLRRILIALVLLIAVLALLVAAGVLVAIGITRIAADRPNPAELRPVTAVAHPILTRAQARAEIEAAGRTWSKFMAQTTDRPRYDTGFVRAWLNQPPAPTGEERP